EAGPLYSITIQKYQKGKHVMAEPGVLPLRSPMSFKEGTREEILGAWDDELKKYSVTIRYNVGVTAIKGQKGAFVLSLQNGETINAEAVILAIGMQGNI